MSFTRSRATRSSLAAVTVAVSAAVQAPSFAQSINATQLSVSVTPIKIEATRLGGEISFIGSGLNAGDAGRLDNTGAYTAGTAFSSTAGATFNLDITVRSADTAATALVAANYATGALLDSNARYGKQVGYFSGNTGGAAAGNLSITSGTAALNTNNFVGTTATAIESTSTRGSAASTEVRRVASSSNEQYTFDTTRQSARYQIAGENVGTLANATMGAAAVGATSSITVATGVSGTNNTFSESVLPGDASVAAVASSTDITNPLYGSTVVTAGGTTAGAFTNLRNMNTMGVNVGGAGTSSTLSVISTMTAF